MKRMTINMLIALVTAGMLAGCEDREVERENVDVSQTAANIAAEAGQEVQEAGREIGDAAEDFGQYAEMQTDEFLTWADEQWDELEVELDEAGQNIENAAANIDNEAREAWRGLSDERAAVERQLEEIRAAGVNATREAKLQAAESMNELENDWDDFQREYKTALQRERAEDAVEEAVE
jgi:hypothetical protein